MRSKIISTLAISFLVIPALASAQISPNTRLLQRPEWDGAIVTGSWLLGQLRYQDWDEGEGWGFGPTFAISPPEAGQLEFGGRAWYIHFDPDRASSESGISDIDIWGKYQFADDPALLSGGIMITLPTGDDDIIHPWTSGEVNVELFGTGRYYITDIFALIGHIGFRFNSDADIEVGSEEFGSVEEERDGKVSFQIGAGVIYQVTYELNLLGEFNIESERYKDSNHREADNDIELTGGVEYFITDQFALKGGLGIGLDDGAPDWELISAGLFMF